MNMNWQALVDCIAYAACYLQFDDSLPRCSLELLTLIMLFLLSWKILQILLNAIPSSPVPLIKINKKIIALLKDYPEVAAKRSLQI